MGIERSRRGALPIACCVLLAAVVLGACSDGDDKPAAGSKSSTTVGADGSGEAATAETVAVRRSDLPGDFVRCSFAGEIRAYMENFKSNPRMYEGLTTTWRNLEATGAVAGWYSTFASNEATCASMQGQPNTHPPEAHDPANPQGHPSEVFTFVTQYKDEASAQAAYQNDVFGQSGLGGGGAKVVVGDLTGLGPNSAVSFSPGGGTPVRQGVWQNKAFTVFFGTEALSAGESERVTSAVNSRIR